LTPVDDYLASQPAAARAVLARVRDTLRRALPDAVEGVSYRIPVFKRHGRPVIYFAAWKGHYSLYPATAPMVEAFADALSRYEVSKGTIRFPLSARVPVALIARLARFRAREVDARQRARARRSAPTPARASTRRPAHTAAASSTAADFRRLALALAGAEEGSHMGAVDFRVGGRIFATLASIAEGFGNLLLTPEAQAAFVAERPDLFVPVAGGWGRMGATHIRLAAAPHDVLAGALEAAWRLRVEKNAGARASKAGRRGLRGTPRAAAARRRAD
jgi:uncharacterized protein YdhG (YjbR/CyaY superfamily)